MNTATDYPRGQAITIANLEDLAHINVAGRQFVRKRWEPHVLQMKTLGLDNRNCCYRYITPGSSAVFSMPIPMEGCQDIILVIQTGRVLNSTPTLTASLSFSMYGGEDFWSNAVDVTPSGAGLNVVTCSSSASQFLTINSADQTTASNVHRRGWTPNHWGFYLTGSAAGVPATVWAIGR